MSKLFIVSGVSGSGKTTLMRSVMSNEVVSFTTRRARPGEIDKIDYNFITYEEFKKLVDCNNLVESNLYDKNYYGISKNEVDCKLEKGDAFAIVDYNGMKQLKNIYPDSETIYIYVNKKAAKKQMKSRGDSEKSIKNRLATYKKEIRIKHEYDYIVFNKHKKFDQSLEKIKRIVEGKYEKAHRYRSGSSISRFVKSMVRKIQ